MPKVPSLTSANVQTSLPLYTHQNPLDKGSSKTKIKVSLIGITALLGTIGSYLGYRHFVGKGTSDQLALPNDEQTGLKVFSAAVMTRGAPVQQPIENQQTSPGAFFTLSRTFFAESGNGLVTQKVMKSPSWLVQQFDPVTVSFSTGFGQAVGIQIVGNTAYVAAQGSGLLIYSIVNSTFLSLLGSYVPPSNAGVCSLQVIGAVAYLASSSNGIFIVNIASPKAPALLGTYVIPGGYGFIQGISVSGNILCATNAFGGLQIINVANPSSPTLFGSYKTQDDAEWVQIVGNLAYVADRMGGLQIINIATPSAPKFVGSFPPNLGAYRVLVVGNIAYVGGDRNGLQIIDVSVPSAPTLLVFYSPGSSFYWIDIQGNTLYLADLAGSGSFQIVNVANPRNPIPIASYAIDNPESCKAFGNNVLVGTVNGLQFLSQLNQIKFSGVPSIRDQGDFVVSLNGTTPQGVAFNSFKLRVGQPPSPVLAISQVVARLNQQLNYTFELGVFFDRDDQNTLIYSINTQNGNPLPSWLFFSSATRTLLGTPGVADIATVSLRYMANDTYFAPTSVPFTLKVEAPPMVANPLKDLTLPRNTLLNFYLPSNAFVDPNGDLLTYTARKNGTYPLPSWLAFSNIGFFTGMPPNYERLNLTVVADDGNGGLTSNSFSLLITDALAPMAAVIGGKVSYQVPSNVFATAGTITSYSGSLADGIPLPNWIQFDPTSLTFTASPPNDVPSTMQLEVAATTSLGEVFRLDFAMNLAGNTPPVYKNPVSTQQASVDIDFKFVVADNVFVDPNGDPLTFKALQLGGASLPKWLNFEPNNRIFSGIPTPEDTNTFTDAVVVIALMANDGQATTTGTFNIAVSGEPYLIRFIKIAGPALTIASAIFGGYKKRALILNRINKIKYTKDPVSLTAGQEFFYQFSCSPRAISNVTLSVLSQKGVKTKLYSKMDGSRFFCRKKFKNWTKVSDVMSHWLSCNAATGTLYSLGGVPNFHHLGPMRITAIGNAGVILEQFDLTILENTDVPSTFIRASYSRPDSILELANQDRSSQDRSSWGGDRDMMIPLNEINPSNLGTIGEERVNEF